MTGARRGALIALGAAAIAALAVAAALVAGSPSPLPPRPASQRPVLLLLTSLPLVFGEGFSLNDTGSPTLKALAMRYRVVPISTADVPELAKGRLLLMAHPAAQPPEDLVALDAWVRSGGRVLLLADPLLEWPSERPLGDMTRPPPAFTDTGLLAHWGVRLEQPEERGPSLRSLAGFRVVTISPGQLFGDCWISKDRFVAQCNVGTGKATIVADADMLYAARLGREADHNLDALVSELGSLERK